MNVLRTFFVLVVCGSSILACKKDPGDGSNGTGGSGGLGTGGMGTGGMLPVAGMTGGMMGTGSTGVAGMTGTVAGMPTFDAIYNEVIIATGCNGGPTCHGGTLGAGGLAMPDKPTAYAALVNVLAMGMNLPPNPAIPNCIDSGKIRVIPGNPDMSLLLEKILPNPSCGVQMPQGGALTVLQIDQIRMWIAMGAMNN